jgi:hypothetical protein
MPVCMFKPTPQPEAPVPVLKLSYLGYVVGWLDSGSAFEPADNDDLYINAAILSRLAA